MSKKITTAKLVEFLFLAIFLFLHFAWWKGIYYEGRENCYSCLCGKAKNITGAENILGIFCFIGLLNGEALVTNTGYMHGNTSIDIKTLNNTSPNYKESKTKSGKSMKAVGKIFLVFDTGITAILVWIIYLVIEFLHRNGLMRRFISSVDDYFGALNVMNVDG